MKTTFLATNQPSCLPTWLPIAPRVDFSIAVGRVHIWIHVEGVAYRAAGIFRCPAESYDSPKLFFREYENFIITERLRALKRVALTKKQQVKEYIK